MMRSAIATAMVTVLSVGSACAAPTFIAADFIPVASRSLFNGFESVPFALLGNVGTDTSYAEGGLTATMVKGGVSTLPGGAAGSEGERFWYSDGGNHGFVRLTREDGGDFANVGFLAGDGFGGAAVIFVYDLRLDGTQVLFGTYVGPQGQYLGFAGGGFDEVRVIGAPAVPDFGADFRDIYPTLTAIEGGTFEPENFNAVWVDSVEAADEPPCPCVPVPAPASAALFAAALGAGVTLRRRAR